MAKTKKTCVEIVVKCNYKINEVMIKIVLKMAETKKANNEVAVKFNGKTIK